MLVLRVLFRITVEGEENIPRHKGFILVANHRTNFDPLLAVFKIYKQVRFMAKAELFRSRVGGWFFRSVGAFPVERGRGDTGAVDWAIALIRAGEVLGMFPEGTRSPDGKTLRPKSGTAMVAMQTGADVLPCALCFGEKLGFRGSVTIRYGKLIENAALGFTPGSNSPHEIKAASRVIMDTIIGLTEEGA